MPDVLFVTVLYTSQSTQPAPETNSVVTFTVTSSRIQKHYSTLVECMDPEFGLLDRLLATSVLTERQMKEVNAENTTSRKNEAILGYLLRWEERLLDRFLKVLSETSQTHVARCLTEGQCNL